MRKDNPNKFFSASQEQELVRTIGEVEALSSGEIRVHLARRCKTNPLEEAKRVFEKLGMTRTKERNGILFFLSLKDRQFVILGDRGIHEKVQDDFWRGIRDEVLRHFQQENFLAGLIAGIRKCGEVLSDHFPRSPDDRNELPNEISSF